MSVLVVVVVVAVIFASMAEAKKTEMNLMEDVKIKVGLFNYLFSFIVLFSFFYLNTTLFPF
jgi:hypothetical protein